MLGFVKTAVLGSSFLYFGFALNAQVYQSPDYDYGERQIGNAADQVRSDLDQMIATENLTRSQRMVLAQAREDLREFDRVYEQGRFDRHELDEAIGRIQSVARGYWLSEEQRAMLQDDVEHLRQMRAASGYSGYGNTEYGYYRGNGYYRRYNYGYYDQYGRWHQSR